MTCPQAGAFGGFGPVRGRCQRSSDQAIKLVKVGEIHWRFRFPVWWFVWACRISSDSSIGFVLFSFFCQLPSGQAGSSFGAPPQDWMNIQRSHIVSRFDWRYLFNYVLVFQSLCLQAGGNLFAGPLVEAECLWTVESLKAAETATRRSQILQGLLQGEGLRVACKPALWEGLGYDRIDRLWRQMMPRSAITDPDIIVQ